MCNVHVCVSVCEAVCECVRVYETVCECVKVYLHEHEYVYMQFPVPKSEICGPFIQFHSCKPSCTFIKFPLDIVIQTDVTFET